MRDHAPRRFKIHGWYGTPEYDAYFNAKIRCTNPRSRAWKNYGGRGVQFRFQSFLEFISHIGPKPSSEHTLDRIDNNSHYEIGNVRWLLHGEQSRNRRNSVLTVELVRRIRELRKEGVPVTEIAVRLGVNRWNVSDCSTRGWVDVCVS